MGPFHTVSAGKQHSCLTPPPPNTGPICVGRNDLGQTLSPNADLVMTSAGDHHSCAFNPNLDLLECWGDDTWGQVSGLPVGPQWEKGAAGRDHSCAFDDSGDVYCWGACSHGIVGGQPVTGAWRDVQLGADQGCLIESGTDGLVCWGDGADPATQPATAKSLSVGNGYACATGPTDDIVCWNDGTADPRVDDAPIAGTWSQVAVGDSGACALSCSGEVSCWGSAVLENSAPGGYWRDLAVGGYHACVVDEYGTTACWGANGYGQLNLP